MDFDALHQKLKTQHKLKTLNSGGTFGVIKRIPLHVYLQETQSEEPRQPLIIIMSTASAQAGSHALTKLQQTGPLKEAKLTDPETLSTKGALVQITLQPEQLAKLNTESLLSYITETATLISKVPQAVPWPAPGAKLVLLDGVIPTHLMIDEAGNIESHQTGMFPLDNHTANMILAGVLGLAATLVGHFVWAYIYYFVHTSETIPDKFAFILCVLAAVWFGALIGWLTIKGAGVNTPVVSVLVVLLCCFGIFMGEILGYALFVQHNSGIFDFQGSTQAYMENLMTNVLESVVGLLFPMIGAFIGAFIAAGVSGKNKTNAKIEYAESGVHRQAMPAERTTASV